MASKLAVPKGMKVKIPDRAPDYRSARGVPYWFAPDWIRADGGRIKPIKKGDYVDLYMLSKSGNLTYIQGRIQDAFWKWHEDEGIDCILLGIDPDDILLTDWNYE